MPEITIGLVRGMTREFVEAWNRGDLVGACEAYAEDAVYVSKSGPIHGKGRILAHYEESFPNRAAMGKLNFSLVDFRPGTAAAIWRWSIERANDKSTGHVLEVYERRDGRILIVYDATITTESV